MDGLFSESGRRGQRRSVSLWFDLSRSVPEGLTDSTAKYNVLETRTMTAINLNYHINPLLENTHVHKHRQRGTFFNDKVVSLQVDSERVKVRGDSVSEATARGPDAPNQHQTNGDDEGHLLPHCVLAKMLHSNTPSVTFM